MARFNTPQTSEFPFHITGRRHNKTAFDLDLDTVWKIMSDHLYLTHHLFGLKIYSFVLMPNHFHLICGTNSEPLGTALGYFMRETSKSMNLLSGNINQNWGSRYFRCEIPTSNYYINCYKYAYQNPMRANLVSKCENWKYSTLNGLLGRTHLFIPTVEDTLLFTDTGSLIEENLVWLNQKITDENILAMRKALKKTKYKLPRNGGKKNHPLEGGLI